MYGKKYLDHRNSTKVLPIYCKCHSYLTDTDKTRQEIFSATVSEAILWLLHLDTCAATAQQIWTCSHVWEKISRPQKFNQSTTDIL